MAHVRVVETVVEATAEVLTLRDSATHPSALEKVGVVGNELWRPSEVQSTPLSPSRRIDGERYLDKPLTSRFGRTAAGASSRPCTGLALGNFFFLHCALHPEDADATL